MLSRQLGRHAASRPYLPTGVLAFARQRVPKLALPRAVPLTTSAVRLDNSSSSGAQADVHAQHPTSQIDPSYANMLRSVDLSMQRPTGRRRQQLQQVDADGNDLQRRTGSGPAQAGEGMHDRLDWDALGSDGEHAYEAPEGLDRHAFEGEDGMDEYGAPRAERRSPAAVLGTKRIGVVVLPDPLIEAVTTHIKESDPREVRQTYLNMVTSQKTPQESTMSYSGASKKSPTTPTTVLARAAAYMPAEYAAVRNVLAEIGRREGPGWLDRAGLGTDGQGGGVVEVTSTIGAGAWALLDHKGGFEGWVSEKEMRTVQEEAEEGMEKDFEETLLEAEEGEEVEVAEMDAAQLDASITGQEDQTAAVESTESPIKSADEQAEEAVLQELGLEAVEADAADEEGPAGPRIHVVNASRAGSDLATSLAAAMSTFYLSALPTTAAQKSHLGTLMDLSAEYIVLIDRSTPQGWQAISHARTYLLKKLAVEEANAAATAPAYHVLAPCPHQGKCPIVAMGGQDKCSFSQRLQRPPFLRKTKHSSKGEEDVGYCYLVLKRNAWPDQSAAAERVGRVGGVGREDEIKSARKNAERGNVLQRVVQIEGGDEVEQYELFAEPDHASSSSSAPVPESARADSMTDEQEADMMRDLRQEAYQWPRLVAPPIKRSGHVIMDACCPNGQIQRLTFSKSHSKQGYYDARKSAWGDLFPHASNNKVVSRTRGIKRLNKADRNAEASGSGSGAGSFGLATKVEEFQWPVGEVLQDDIDAPSGGGGRDFADFTAEEMAEAAAEGISFSVDEGPEAPRAGRSARLGGGAEAGSKALGKGKDMHKSSRRARKREHGAKRGFATSARQASARPMEPRSTDGAPARAKVTIQELRHLSSARTPITCLTAYDYPTALLSETSGVDMVLVGDSLSQVALGHTSTNSITLDEMIHHCKAVTRGAKTPFVFADLPFGSFEASVEQGVRSVIRLIKESGVDGVKIEGGREILPLVKRLSSIGIPVIPHLGLQPQRATSTSGYLVQGRTASAAHEVYAQALEMHDIGGAFAVLLEAIPHAVASHITDAIPSLITIGIGAGPGTSGQVLVVTDVLGTYTGMNAVVPRFVRHFGDVAAEARRAAGGFVEAVKSREFPQVGKETYGMKKDEWEGYLAKVQGEAAAPASHTSSGDAAHPHITKPEGATKEETVDGA